VAEKLSLGKLSTARLTQKALVFRDELYQPEPIGFGVLPIRYGQQSARPILDRLDRNRAMPPLAAKTIFDGTKRPVVVEISHHHYRW
jgi:hypothetical protein